MNIIMHVARPSYNTNVVFYEDMVKKKMIHLMLTGIRTWRIFVGGHREAGDTPSVMKHIGGVTKCV